MPKYTVKIRNTKELHEVECDNVLIGEHLIKFVDSRGVNFLSNTGEHSHLVAYFPTEAVANILEDGKCKFTAASGPRNQDSRKALQVIFDICEDGHASPSVKKAYDEFMHDFDEGKLVLAVTSAYADYCRKIHP